MTWLLYVLCCIFTYYTYMYARYIWEMAIRLVLDGSWRIGRAVFFPLPGID